ncbi:AsmA family protein [Legionella impletisoli]|uniref:AsmA protein n=1 Tax=Legionella impletisoli TaxID=343510 RepID=A0A917N9Q4_9GAMM|nr:AsmA family protein [Legionella impletisoli]GGI81243.1 AsmA protein [Legionella impletisoli]
MNVLKKIFFIFLATILVLVIGLWLFLKTLEPEWVKTYLSKQITLITGLPSHINGTVSWQVFPTPGVKVNHIQMGEDNIKSKLKLSINDLILKLQIKPLFHGKLVFSEIKIDGVDAVIHPNAPAPAIIKTTPAKKKESKNKLPPSKIVFAIENFHLTNGHINVIQDEAQYTLNDLHIGLSQLNLENKYFPLQLTSTLAINSPKHSGHAAINYKGKIKLSNEILYFAQKSLSGFNTIGQLSLSDIKLNQFYIEKITANTQVQNNAIQFDPLKVTLYEGESIGNISYQFDTQIIRLNQTATNLNLEPLLKDLLNKNLMVGKLDLTTHGNARLSDTNWLSSLRVKGGASVKDGKLLFMDIQALVNELLNRFQTLMSNPTIDPQTISELTDLKPEEYQKGITKFNTLNLTYDTPQSMLLNNSIVLQTNKFELSGQGVINLQQMTIHNGLNLKLSSNNNLAKIQAIFSNGIPLLLQGQLSKPVIYPDMKQISTTLTQYYLKKTLDKPVKQLKEEVKSFFDSL